MTKARDETDNRLFILPSAPGEGPPSVIRQSVSLSDAIKHVMEALPADQRQRAVIETSIHLIFFSEIKAIYETGADGLPRTIRRLPVCGSALERRAA